ncbi:MAG: hypothetical protein KJ050_10440 [Candidatus Omnitrophica bacterium]|nr:hypothetical protein [bacterium]MBK7495705.1 hypothetical protein [Candidatus Omnitrophota bacterium]MCE7909524.1 hypothetical protein [Candidatus Omnitrophica bacterium COP1]MBV6482398.1 hypothetical protein [bacterium]MCC6731602.1 hypothetical protein [Candidatus Omnitrophota bacterium]
MDERNLPPEEQKNRILNSKTPYEALFLPTTATPGEAKARYFKLVKRFSPEREEETFRKVRRAYEELRNPARKAAVDVMLFSGPRSKVGFQGIASAAQSQVKLNREIEHLTPLISESPQSRADLILALKHRFLLLARHKMWNEALKDLDQIEELDGPSENLRINRINIISHQALELAQKGLYADAAHRWRRALRYDADNPNLLHNLAICASLLINKEEENKYWVDTLRVWHQQLGDHEDNEYLKHLIVETHKRFGGRFLNQTGDESLGNQMPKPGVHPASPGSPHAAGEIGQGQTPEEPEPGGPPGSPVSLGQNAFKQRNWQGAISSFELHLADHPQDGPVMDKLAWAYLRADQAIKAFSLWQKMIQEGPDSTLARKSFVQAKLETARSLRSRKMINPALVQLKDALKLVNDAAVIYQELGDIYSEKQEWVNASFYYEKSIEFNPTDKNVRALFRAAKTRARSFKG